jgi:CheY-like chemotaxis protein
MEQVLIVDDDKNIREVFRRLLKKNAYDVYVAGSVSEAQMLFQSHLFDIVLIDIQMPGGCGNELIEYIQNKKLKCAVMVSSVFPVEDQRRVIPKADEYFDKSDGLKVLIEKLHTLRNTTLRRE